MIIHDKKYITYIMIWLRSKDDLHISVTRDHPYKQQTMMNTMMNIVRFRINLY